MSKPIAIRTTENTDKPFIILVNPAKYTKIIDKLEDGEEYNFILTKKEIEATKEFQDKLSDLNEADEEGGSIASIALAGLPIISSLLGKIFNGGRIYLTNSGGRLSLGGKKKIPTFSAYLRQRRLR
jgi:hypothetical protein